METDEARRLLGRVMAARLLLQAERAVLLSRRAEAGELIDSAKALRAQARQIRRARHGHADRRRLDGS